MFLNTEAEMQKTQSIAASADACTNHHPAPTNADIEWAVSLCGEFVTIGQIITGLDLNPITTPPAVEANIRTWLDNAGWDRVKRTSGGVRAWGYEKPAGTNLQYVALNPKPKAWKEYLRWAARDLASPEIRLDPTRLVLERQVTATRLGPYMEEIVQLAWAQLQAQESAVVKNGGATC